MCSERERARGNVGLLQPRRSLSLRAQLPCLPELGASSTRSAPRHTAALGRLSALVNNHQTMGCTDWNLRERIANVATSAPFFALGAWTCAHANSPAGRLYGSSLFGVGTAAVLYHTSAGVGRPHWRTLDYLTIATSATLLLRALSPPGSKHALHPALSACGALLVPLHPLAAAGAHAALAEAKFLARARAGTHQLRQAHRRHVAASVAAGALFVGEEIWPDVPLVHAAWHCAAAVALSGFGNLLRD